ncbi:hypothetical protein KW796_00335 [Candidatus Parcubacteria bacterium]|nr:hypothetical protein [Candidatus Parcubacteria bacterium]
MDISSFLDKVNALIINPIIVLLFAIAFLVFFFGIFQFVGSAGESGERDKGKKKIMYGLIGMFIMFSAYGLIRLVLGTFGINAPSYINR